MSDRIETFARYEILIVPGQNDRLILSFAGIGNMATGAMGFEWRRTFEEINTGDHIIYIKDLTRSWFNTREGFHEMVAFLKAYITEHQITSTTAIGLSMGAYGSFVMGKYLPLTRAIAINPRSSLEASGAFDPRNRELVAAIGEGPHLRLAELMNEEIDYLLIFTLENAEDLQHAQRLMSQAPKVTALCYHGPHNIGEAYTKHGQLLTFLRAAISNDRPALRNLDLMPITAPDADQLLAHFSKINPVRTFATAPAYLVPPSYDEAYRQMCLTKAVSEGKPAQFHPVLRAGHLLKSEQLLPYLLTGWYRPEPTGIWSAEQEHTIVFSMVEQKIIRKAHLVLSGHAFVPASTVSQRVLIKVNGHHVVDLSLQHNNPHFRLEIPLPDALQIAVHIETPNATSPAQISGNPSHDRRNLAIWLSGMELVADYF